MIHRPHALHNHMPAVSSLQYDKSNSYKFAMQSLVLKTRRSLPMSDTVVLLHYVCVSADGIVIESHGLIIDEASLTGEADPIKKTLEDPWVRSGTQVWIPYLPAPPPLVYIHILA